MSFQNVLGKGVHHSALGQDGDPGDAHVRDHCWSVGDYSRVCGSDCSHPYCGIRGDYRICLHKDAGREYDDGISTSKGKLLELLKAMIFLQSDYLSFNDSR